MSSAASPFSVAPLPTPRSSFVGRAAEIAAARALLLNEAVPLLTLTGPGGVGKTRLALAVGHDIAADFGDGTAFVDLAPLRDGALVLPTIARALAVNSTGNRPMLDVLLEYLRRRQVLILLDNCEQVLTAAPGIASLLAGCPALQILATSRAPLNLRVERELRVAPLSLPEEGNVPATDLVRSDAVALFLQRRPAVDATGIADEADLRAIGEICRRLDGLPLAIELAAPRLKILSPAALLARLTDRLRILTDGPVDLPDRQRTMRDVIAWSHDLLPPEEQANFQRLAVFVGGFSLEAAEAVLAACGASPIALLDAVARLVDQSLLKPDARSKGGANGDEPRFAMLETIREFGLARLAASGEEATVRSAHARYFLSLAERGRAVRFLPVETWESRVQVEHHNVLAAMDWFEANCNDEALARLGAAMHHMWQHYGHLTAVRPTLERALARTVGPPASRAKLLLAVGSIGGDKRLAATYLDQAITLFRALDDGDNLTRALNFRAINACELGDLDRADATLAEVLARSRELGQTGYFAWAVGQLGVVATLRGQLDRAVPLLEEALVILRQVGDQFGAATTLNRLGWTHLERGEFSQVATRLAESLDLSWAGGYRTLLTWSFSFVARLAAQRGQPEAAARLFGAEEALRVAIGEQVPDAERTGYEAGVALARAALPPEAFAAAWATGEALPLAEAFAEARALATDAWAASAPEPTREPAVASAVDSFGLSVRERQVLVLLAQRRTDKEIAETLFVSPRTASGHVAGVFDKLGVNNRREAAAVAARLGLV